MAQKRDTYKYQFKVGNKIVHGGITNDLERRQQEHRQKWPKGHIKQVGNKTTEEAARKWEKTVSGKFGKWETVSGKFVVTGPQKGHRGTEEWTINPKGKGGSSRSVSSSSSTAVSLDRIAKKHSKALKRLADK